MRRALAAAAVLAVVGVTAVAPGSAWPEAAGPSGGPAEFSAEVFAAPSYHLVEIPKVEEGGEGFAWAYLNQQPEGWGRAISFWPGPTGDTVARSSTPQDGPLARSQRVSSRRLREASGWVPRMRAGTQIWQSVAA